MSITSKQSEEFKPLNTWCLYNSVNLHLDLYLTQTEKLLYMQSQTLN